MFEVLLQLVILFLVIFDPLASLSVFFVATKNMNKQQRNKTATLAIIVASVLSFLVLILGEHLLRLVNTTLSDFKIASGIILSILGIKMALGHSLANNDDLKNNSGRAIAAIIGTPLLTGPAAITSIIVSTQDYGLMVTGLAVAIVLFLTGIFFYNSNRIVDKMGITSIQVISTILGLVTLSWGIKFIREGLGF